MTKVFAITGGTGAGKSTVSRLFKKAGVYVADADAAARRVVRKCMPELCREFGCDILNDDGTLNRKKLGGIVFSDAKKLEILNNITHKHIKAHIENEIAACGAELAAIDGAVIIGSPVMELCEFIVVVTANEDVRLSRIMRRDGLSREEALKRIRSQMSDEEYLRHADYIIENNDKVQGEEIERICNEIKAAKKTRRAAKTQA